MIAKLFHSWKNYIKYNKNHIFSVFPAFLSKVSKKNDYVSILSKKSCYICFVYHYLNTNTKTY